MARAPSPHTVQRTYTTKQLNNISSTTLYVSYIYIYIYTPAFLTTCPIMSPTASNPHDCILLFTKYPSPGFAKTRLIPAVGPERAAQISDHLTQKTLTTLRQFQALRPKSKLIIHYATYDYISPQTLIQWLQPTESQILLPQVHGSLGDKLISAFERAFAQNARTVIVVGSDAPNLTPQILTNAFAALNRFDVVIGPALDGGYYLLGAKAMHKHLFTSIPWSTSTVLKRTLAAARSTGLSINLLQPLRDIDTPEDLPFLDSIL